MSDYIIRKLDSNQFDLLLPLMKDCFGMDVDVDYFKWKFLQNPAGSFVGFVAVEPETDEVAAYYGAIPQIFVIDGKRTTIYQSCDTMTHSRHRRRGLFQTLAKHCFEFLRNNDELFIIGLSGPQSTPGFIKFGWQKVFDFENLFVPRVACYAAYLSNYSPKAFDAISDFEAIEDLIERKESTSICSFRDVEHFKWRISNPQREMKVIGYKNRENIYDGYVGYFLQNSKIFLFDFVFRSDESRRALTNYLKRQVLEQKLGGIIAFCQESSSSGRKLRKSGFFVNPFNKGPLHEKTPFIFYADEPVMERYNDPNKWSITSYDHDAS